MQEINIKSDPVLREMNCEEEEKINKINTNKKGFQHIKWMNEIERR